MGVIKDFTIVLPDVIEQQTITDYLDEKCANIDTSIKLLNDGIEQIKAYKTALISEAVTGQIDVRDWREK